MNISDVLPASGVESGQSPVSKTVGSSSDAKATKDAANDSTSFSAALTFSMQERGSTESEASEDQLPTGTAVIVKQSVNTETKGDPVDDKDRTTDNLNLPGSDYTQNLLAAQMLPIPLPIPVVTNDSSKNVATEAPVLSDGVTSASNSARSVDPEIPQISPQAKPPALPAALLQLPGITGFSQPEH